MPLRHVSIQCSAFAFGAVLVSLSACSEGESSDSSMPGAGGEAGGGTSATAGASSAGVAGATGVAGDTSASAGAGGAPDESSAGSGGTGGGAPSSCAPARPADPGVTTVELQHDGLQRDYVLHVPSGYDGTTPLPLVVDIHGYTSWASEQLERTRWGDMADAEGFIVAEPDGVEMSWNAGICCGYAQENAIDDVGFIRAVVDEVSTDLCVDAKRIYATGHSNGGMMTYRLGCEAADLFAAIAPVAGSTPTPAECTPSRPVPVAMIRALNDQTVTYDGNGSFVGAEEDLAKWREVDGCADTPVVPSHNDVCQTYTACTADTNVMACSPRGGHLFFFTPSDNPDELLVPDTVWPFFEQFALP